LYLWSELKFHTPAKIDTRRLRVLSMAPHDQRLTRVSPSAFELEVLGRPRRVNDFERLYRSRSWPLEPGQSYVAGELRAQVVATTNGVADKVRFELDTSLDAPSVCLIAWRDGHVQPVPVPGVGRSIAVPREPGPLGM